MEYLYKKQEIELNRRELTYKSFDSKYHEYSVRDDDEMTHNHYYVTSQPTYKIHPGIICQT